MNQESATETPAVDEALDNSITLLRCELKGELLCRRGEPIVMPLVDAMRKFTQNTKGSRANILGARVGNYIGLIKIGREIKNFLIVNRNKNGNIGWILRDKPELSTLIQEVYLVQDIVIRRTAVDLPSSGGVA